MMALLVGLGVSFSAVAGASGGVAASSNVDFYIPQTDEYVYSVGQGNDSGYCFLETINTYVELYNGEPNHTYNVDWDMRLGLYFPSLLIDIDNATNSAVATDAFGKWRHYAHGQSPGYLSGAPLLPLSSYSANASSWISVPGGQPGTHTAAASRTFYVAH